MCEYEITVSTPLICTKQLESESLQRLDELGVFGFGGKSSKNPNSARDKQNKLQSNPK